MKFILILIIILLSHNKEICASEDQVAEENHTNKRKNLTIKVVRMPDTFIPSPMALTPLDQKTTRELFIETKNNLPSLYLDSRPKTDIGRSLFSEHYVKRNEISVTNCLKTLFSDSSCLFINHNYYANELRSETPTSVRDIYKLHRVHNFPFNYQEAPKATLKIFDTSKPILKEAVKRLIKLLDSSVFSQDVSDGFFPPYFH